MAVCDGGYVAEVGRPGPEAEAVGRRNEIADAIVVVVPSRDQPQSEDVLQWDGDRGVRCSGMDGSCARNVQASSAD